MSRASFIARCVAVGACYIGFWFVVAYAVAPMIRPSFELLPRSELVAFDERTILFGNTCLVFFALGIVAYIVARCLDAVRKHSK